MQWMIESSNGLIKGHSSVLVIWETTGPNIRSIPKCTVAWHNDGSADQAAGLAQLHAYVKTKAQKWSQTFKGNTGKSKKYSLHNTGPPVLHISRNWDQSQVWVRQETSTAGCLLYSVHGFVGISSWTEIHFDFRASSLFCHCTDTDPMAFHRPVSRILTSFVVNQIQIIIRTKLEVLSSWNLRVIQY